MTEIIQIPADVLKDRAEVVARAKTHQITDQTSYDFASDSLAWARDLEKRIEAHYEPFRVTAKAAYDSILAAKKADLDPIVEVKAILSRSVAAYQVAQEKLQQDEQRRQDGAAAEEAWRKRQKEVEEAKAAGATKTMLQRVASAPIVVQMPTVGPTYTRSKYVSAPIERWRAEVPGDEGLLLLVKAVAAGKQPLALLLPNQTALNRMAAALKDKMNIPGVKAVCEHTASVKAGI